MESASQLCVELLEKKKKSDLLSTQRTPTPWSAPGRLHHKGASLTCVVLVALSGAGQQLRHGGAHCFGCASQVLSAFFQL